MKKKFLALLFTVAALFVIGTTAFAQDMRIISGTITFDETPTSVQAKDSDTYYRYYISDGTTIKYLYTSDLFYAPITYTYNGASVTIECEYLDTIDGVEYYVPYYLVEGETKTDFYDYALAHYFQTNPTADFSIFREYFDWGDEFIHVSDDGTTMRVDTNPYNLGITTLGAVASLADKAVGNEMVQKINKLFGFPDYVWYEMASTHANDGKQTEQVDNFYVSWSYSSIAGLEVLYIRK